MKKIIIFSVTYQNQRDVDRLGYKKFSKNGFLVEHWNLGSIIYPDYNNNFKPKDIINLFPQKQIKSIDDLDNNVKNISEKILIIDPWNLINRISINNIVNKDNILLCSYFINNSFYFEKKLKKINYLTIIKLKIINFFMKLFYFLFRNKQLDYFVAAGSLHHRGDRDPNCTGIRVDN